MLIGVDSELVITQTIPGLLTLWERWERGVGVTGARRVGRALAELHGLPTRELDKAPLNIDPRGAGVGILDLGPGFREVIRLLQMPVVHDCLSALEARLRSDSEVVAHGDVRGTNVLFSRDAVWLIDWETCGTDSRWRDVGAAIAMLVEHAIELGGGPPNPKVFGGLLHEYEVRGGVQIEIETVVQVAGARLLQFAAERGRSEWPIGVHSQAIISAGKFLLLHPHEGAARLGLQK
jgi:hypothetical protein